MGSLLIGGRIVFPNLHAGLQIDHCSYCNSSIPLGFFCILMGYRWHEIGFGKFIFPSSCACCMAQYAMPCLSKLAYAQASPLTNGVICWLSWYIDVPCCSIVCMPCCVM